MSPPDLPPVTGALRGSSRGAPPPRTVQLSGIQWDVLEANFTKVKNPHPTDLLLLAAEIGLDESDVQAWYTQRLAAWRKEQGLNPVSGRVD